MSSTILTLTIPVPYIDKRVRMLEAGNAKRTALASNRRIFLARIELSLAATEAMVAPTEPARDAHYGATNTTTASEPGSGTTRAADPIRMEAPSPIRALVRTGAA